MTVGELVAELQKWDQSAEVAVSAPGPNLLADVREIQSVNYWAAYNMAYVVID
jgi:hypothetical protein